MVDVPQYLYFCRPDTLFHDHPDFEDGAFELISRPARAGWQHHSNREWVTFLAPGQLPQQGWKVHVSSTPDEAEEVLAICAEHCLEAGLTFKFLRSPACLMMRSSKYADRSGSGKFITIYPTDDAALATLLGELGDALAGRPGPYILSDLRWREGPLYVRYGGFVDRLVRAEDGSLLHAIEDPDGRLVPDHRGPSFRPPEWAPRPEPVQEALEARQHSKLTDFPFRPVKALHFSNGGGVYRAVSREGAQVLLKEARPLAGLDSRGDDAVTRLERERWAYEHLAGMAEIPRLFDYRRGHEHYFLAREEVDGADLQHLIFSRNPLLRAGAEPQDFLAYARWAQDMVEKIERGLDEMHRRGVVYADLHPGNVLVRGDGSIRFIDLEASRSITDTSPQAMAAPGYAAPRSHTGPAIDRYALGILRMAIFLPIPSLLNWEETKIEQFLAMIADRFDIPDDFEERVRRDLALPPPSDRLKADGAHSLSEQITPSRWPTVGEEADAVRWRGLADRLAEGLVACATPERPDRLYPGDVQQLQHPDASLGLSHGAAGVMWALLSCGYDVPSTHRRWLLDAVRRHPWTDPGLRDGLAGVALVLAELDETDLAEELIGRALDIVGAAPDGPLSPSAAGVGLTALRLAGRTGSEDLLDRSAALAGRSTHTGATALPVRGPGNGLFHGRTAVAAFLLALRSVTPDDQLVTRAADLLRDDLDEVSTATDPSLPASTSPLLERGAGGTALVVDRLLEIRHDPDLAAVRDRVLAETQVPFLVDGGLYAGRAGVLAARAWLLPREMSPGDRVVQDHHLRALGLHVVGLGEQLCSVAPLALRLSCDLATGAAGVLTAVAVAGLGRRVELPALPPASAAPAPGVGR